MGRVRTVNYGYLPCIPFTTDLSSVPHKAVPLWDSPLLFHPAGWLFCTSSWTSAPQGKCPSFPTWPHSPKRLGFLGSLQHLALVLLRGLQGHCLFFCAHLTVFWQLALLIPDSCFGYQALVLLPVGLSLLTLLVLPVALLLQLRHSVSHSLI